MGYVLFLLLLSRLNNFSSSCPGVIYYFLFFKKSSFFVPFQIETFFRFGVNNSSDFSKSGCYKELVFPCFLASKICLLLLMSNRFTNHFHEDTLFFFVDGHSRPPPTLFPPPSFPYFGFFGPQKPPLPFSSDPPSFSHLLNF